MREIKVTTKNGKIACVHGVEKPIKYLNTQSDLKVQCNLYHNA